LSAQAQERTQAADQPLAGRVAVVTGASSGIGQAAARRLARAGARVALVNRAGSKLEEARRAVADAGGEALGVEADAASHISGTEIWIDGAQSLLQG
jgi:NAD(P)-dependent dehydrogenase (short-subunit alcohol dehydrogenase family)